MIYTVNLNIFAGGKVRKKVGKVFHVGVIFTILYSYLLWVLFSSGGNFRKEDKNGKNVKIVYNYPHTKISPYF